MKLFGNFNNCLKEIDDVSFLNITVDVVSFSDVVTVSLRSLKLFMMTITCHAVQCYRF